ncbi:hypothetical protein PM082_008557 [Marasmius tenuissimus]|nr:hypothetical protein PM082_008557 [Marasmius tenuissimus]
MNAAKFVSPSPPPTSNTLTQTQRTRLMRTTKKLSQVLGSTPQLMDTKARSSTPVDTDWSDSEDDWYRPASRGSNRSITSGLSSSSGSTASSSLISRSISITRSRRSSSRSEDSSNSSKPPLLRLALASFAQRSSTANKCYPSPASANSSDDEDSRFTLQTTFTESPRDSFVSPDFRIPSSTTLRLQKMDRIRKKLGDGVPVKLVFPDSDEEERQQSRPSTSHTVIQLKTLPPLPPTLPTPRPRPSKSRRVGSRDSIVSTSAHRGQRVKRKPVPTLEQLTQSAPSSLLARRPSAERQG